mgnify:CR=1 FL=1
MTIKTLYNLGDIVTFYPQTIKKQEPVKGTIVDLYIYLSYGIKCNKRTLRIMYIVQSGEQGYHVYENQIISGKRFKRREKTCEVLLSD